MKIPAPELCSPQKSPVAPPGRGRILLGGHTTGWGRDGSQEQLAWALQGHRPSLAEGQASQEGNWILPLFELSIFIIIFC